MKEREWIVGGAEGGAKALHKENHMNSTRRGRGQGGKGARGRGKGVQRSKVKMKNDDDYDGPTPKLQQHSFG